MNTELSPEITISCSKGHGKIANNNRIHRLSRITGHGRNNIRLQSSEHEINMLQELNIAKQGMAVFY